MHLDHNDTGYQHCACQPQLDHIVLCNDETRSVRVIDGYIMTYNSVKNRKKSERHYMVGEIRRSLELITLYITKCHVIG